MTTGTAVLLTVRPGSKHASEERLTEGFIPSHATNLHEMNLAGRRRQPVSVGRRAARGVALACMMSLSSASLAVAASTKVATASTSFTVGADGRCYAVSTATWSGYQVNRVRRIFYREGHVDQDYAWFSTTVLPNGTSNNSGSMTSVSGVAAAPGEGWYVHDLFRSNGGAILAEATSAVAYAPTTCPAP